MKECIQTYIRRLADICFLFSVLNKMDSIPSSGRFEKERVWEQLIFSVE